MPKILVTGALGQIGSELVPALRQKYGRDSIFSSDIRSLEGGEIDDRFFQLDVLDAQALADLVEREQIDSIFHLAAILSAVGEKNPQLAWQINMQGLYNVLEVAREKGLRVMTPSSIAAFGPESPRVMTPQETIQMPKTMYGVTKVAGELLCDYYVKRFGVDARGVRYPGIISSEALPGGGTTDYAVDIYYKAAAGEKYVCFVKPETILPMMYMPDCLKALMDLYEADFDKLKHHSNFNVASMSFSAEEQVEAVRKIVPDLEVEYAPDFRQDIADSWPQSLDDREAREQWGWQPTFDLEAMSEEMVRRLQGRNVK